MAALWSIPAAIHLDPELIKIVMNAQERHYEEILNK